MAKKNNIYTNRERIMTDSKCQQLITGDDDDEGELNGCWGMGKRGRCGKYFAEISSLS